MSQPLLSLLVPNYNASAYFPRFLASVPDSKGLELLIHDDCSGDNPRDYLSPAKERAKITYGETNLGEGGAVNLLYQSAGGRYCQRADPDDELISEGIESALGIAESTDADVILQPFIEVETDGREVEIKRPAATTGSELFVAIWRGEAPALVATLIRRDLAIEAPKFTALRYGTDVVWLLDFLLHHPNCAVAASKTPSYRYIKREGSYSQPTKAESLVFAERSELLLRELKRIQADPRFAAIVPSSETNARIDHSLEITLRAYRKGGKPRESARLMKEFAGASSPKFVRAERFRCRVASILPIWR